MAGLTVRSNIGLKMPEQSQPGTFAANALSCAVCLTNINIITNKEDNLMGRAAKLGAESVARLQDAAKDINIIGDARGRGFFIGIELVADRATKEPLSSDKMQAVLGDLLNAGVTCVPAGRYHNVVRFMPPLIITKNYLDKAIRILIDICRKY